MKNIESKNSYASGNSQLLIEYRKVLINAYELGEDIKEVYGIIPPKVITEHLGKGVDNYVTVGLVVS